MIRIDHSGVCSLYFALLVLGQQPEIGKSFVVVGNEPGTKFVDNLHQPCGFLSGRSLLCDYSNREAGVSARVRFGFNVNTHHISRRHQSSNNFDNLGFHQFLSDHVTLAYEARLALPETEAHAAFFSRAAFH